MLPRSRIWQITYVYFTLPIIYHIIIISSFHIIRSLQSHIFNFLFISQHRVECDCSHHNKLIYIISTLKEKKSSKLHSKKGEAINTGLQLSWQSACLACKRPWVQLPVTPLFIIIISLFILLFLSFPFQNEIEIFPIQSKQYSFIFVFFY